MRSSLHKKNRGVALITVMLIVVLASAAVVAMTSRQQLDIRRTENTLQQAQAQMYLLGIEQWVRHILSEDRRNNETDHLGEAWATRVPSMPVEGGSLDGYVEDLQGRFNLNNLSQGGDAGKAALEQFQRLLNTLGLKEGLATTIKDWVDVDMETSFPDGAEDMYYLGLSPAYRTANRLMISPSELLLLKEVTTEDYETLLPHVCTLPTVTPVNINSATAEVLTSITEDLSLVQMQGIVDAREDDPFEDVDELLSNTIFAGKEIPENLLSVSSNYFVLRSEAKIGHLRQKMNVVYERDTEGKIYSIMRAQGEI